ncbi:MAG TPA: glycosyltransferase family 4 protein [Candidatus Paceibacterota bacterium]|nr:glycosyltransferase family 4 protein [Candidatus Paceibacterota bacterium]
MRLLFVHDRFGAMAGAEVNLHLTASELKTRGHTVGIIHGPATGQSEAAWMEVFEDRFSLATKSNPAVVKSAIRRFEPDAIYVHKTSELGVLQALADAGSPVIRMVHDHDLYCLRSYKYFPLTRKICTRGTGWRCVFPCGAVLARNRNGGLPFKWRSFRDKRAELRLNRKFQRMIVATEYMRQELLRNGFDPKRIEIHAPVPKAFAATPPSNFSDRNLIIYAGQIIRGKGADVLLEALVGIRFPFECVILGDGNHRAHCEQLSRRLGLADRVQFKGYLPPGEMTRFYAEASVAVVSSVWPEPFGAVGLEAMRFGLPVVGFDAGGIREWLLDDENGFLIPWMDRDAFARRVEQLLRDKTLARKLGAEGRRLVRERFGFDHYITGLEGMFARVIGEAQTPVAR